MHTDQFYGELDAAKRDIGRLRLQLGACIAIILVLCSTVRFQLGTDRSVFVPPEISKPFWISGEDASPEYFEQLGQFLNGLTLNFTPETVTASCTQFLTYVLPKDRDKYRKRCDLEAARIRRDNASQSFSVRELRTDAQRRRVVLTGTLITFIADKSFKSKEAYFIEFEHVNGRFYVSNHDKVDANEPFASKKPGAN